MAPPRALKQSQASAPAPMPLLSPSSAAKPFLQAHPSVASFSPFAAHHAEPFPDGPGCTKEMSEDMSFSTLSRAMSSALPPCFSTLHLWEPPKSGDGGPLVCQDAGCSPSGPADSHALARVEHSPGPWTGWQAHSPMQRQRGAQPLWSCSSEGKAAACQPGQAQNAESTEGQLHRAFSDPTDAHEAEEVPPIDSGVMRAVCINFKDVENECQERELEKDALEGVSIIPLQSRNEGQSPDQEEDVLYALYFRISGAMPCIPGSPGTKLLLRGNLQEMGPEDLLDAVSGGAMPLPSSGGDVAGSEPPKHCSAINVGGASLLRPGTEGAPWPGQFRIKETKCRPVVPPSSHFALFSEWKGEY